MRRRKTLEAMPPELQLAIGLVWGHLNAYQYEEAYELALGCLQLWPDDDKLQLMCDHAAAEVMEPINVARLRSLRNAVNADWIALVLRRAGSVAASRINQPLRRA
jgi:hypothetical protein